MIEELKSDLRFTARVASIAGLILKLAMLFALSGCGSASASPAPKSTDDAAALILILELEDVTFQPDARDDLDKPDGSGDSGTSPPVQPGPSDFPNTGEKSVPAASIIVIWGKAGDQLSKNAKADIQGQTKVEFQHSDDAKKYPKWLKEKAAAGEPFPFTEWKTKQDRWFVQSGWQGLAWLMWIYEGSQDKKAATAERRILDGSGSDSRSAGAHPLFSSQFGNAGTWPGDLRQHIQAEHGFTAEQVEAMTDQQVMDAHNAAHGFPRVVIRAQAAGTRPPARARAMTRTYSNCPGGFCPRRI